MFSRGCAEVVFTHELSLRSGTTHWRIHTECRPSWMVNYFTPRHFLIGCKQSFSVTQSRCILSLCTVVKFLSTFVPQFLLIQTMKDNCSRIKSVSPCLVFGTEADIQHPSAVSNTSSWIHLLTSASGRGSSHCLWRHRPLSHFHVIHETCYFMLLSVLLCLLAYKSFSWFFASHSA